MDLTSMLRSNTPLPLLTQQHWHNIPNYLLGIIPPCCCFRLLFPVMI
jgi:hypothetical protein